MVVEGWARWLGLVLVPVVAVVAVDPGGSSPFGPAKAVAVPAVVLVGVAMAGWGQRPRLVRRSALAWSLVLVAMAAAAAGGLDGRAAWFGTSERHLGALTWGLFAAAFAGGQVLGTDQARRAVAAGAVVALAVVGAWSAAEAVGWRPVELVGAGTRLVGPFGSSAFLGAAASLLLPVGLGVAVDATWSRPWRRLAAAATVLGGVGLIGSGARAAWLGVAAAGALGAWRARPAVAAWWAGRRDDGPEWRAVARAAAVVVAVMVTVAAVGVSASVAGRIPAAFTDDRGGVRGRLDEWRVAARTVARHPILGVGPEGGRIAFGAAVDDAYERSHGRSPLPDRAHSGPLDIAVTSGLVGLLLVAWLWVAVGRHLRRAVGGSEPWLIGVALGVTAYAVQQLALFPLAELDPVAWLLAGLVVGATSRREEEAPIPQPSIASAVATAAAAAVLVAGVPTVVADRRAREALVALGEGDIGRARRSAAEAVALAPDALRLRLLAADAASVDGSSAGIDGALVQVGAALRTSPLDPVARTRQGQLLLQRAQRSGSPADDRAAREALERLHGDDPRNAEVLVALGAARARTGDRPGAEAAWHRAEELAPRSAAASTDLAVAASADGRWDEAVAAAMRALERDPSAARARSVLEQAAAGRHLR